MTDENIQYIIKYYNGFASKKEQYLINKILNKPKHNNKDLTILKRFAFKYKMYIESNAANVNSRLNKLNRDSLYAYHNNNKFN